MTSTTDQKLAVPAAGQADWDSSQSANWNILERGYHTTARAGTAIDTFDVLWMNSGGFFFRYDPNSHDIRASALAYTAAASGDTLNALATGVVRSLAIVPGADYYVRPDSPGRLTNVYSGFRRVGFGVDAGGFYFSPQHDFVPRRGAIGDILTKVSSGDYDYGWSAPTSLAAGNGLPTGGSSGDILWKNNTTTDYATVWSPAPTGGGGGGGIAKDAYSPPTAASFSVISGTNGVQPTATDVVSTGLLITFAGSPGPGDNIRFITKARATESFEMIARFRYDGLYAFRFNGVGLILASSGGRATTFCFGAPVVSGLAYAGTEAKFDEWNTIVNSFNAEPMTAHMVRSPEWMRLTVDQNTITAYVGLDANNWNKLFARARSTFQNTIDFAGFGFVINRTDTITIIGTPENHLTAAVLYYAGN